MADDILSLSGSICSIAIINLYGELVYQNMHESAGISGDEIQEQFRKLSFSTSVLAFENVEALKKISELERKLAQHDNAHTPSSKKAIGQKAKSQHGKPQQNGNGKSGNVNSC